MTEKDKMLKGKLYLVNSPHDPTLLNDRLRCQDLCHNYNLTAPCDTLKRKEILETLLGKISENVIICNPFWCDYGYNVEIGKNFFANHNLVILDCAKVIFGDNVLVGPNCGFHTAGHPIDVERRNQGLEYAYPITIGDNVWFGAGVQVLPGVTIGNNSVIGAMSLVTKDIPENCVAFGNPCKVVRPITDKDKLTNYDYSMGKGV